MHSIATIATGAASDAAPSGRNPSRRSCGIGAIKSIRSIGISARTELVPRMNITAMIGAASTTDHAMLRTGFLHSPAWMATYSKPPNAPNPILPSRLRLMIDTTGIAVASG